MRKFCSVLLALAMCLSMLPAALAATADSYSAVVASGGSALEVKGNEDWSEVTFKIGTSDVTSDKAVAVTFGVNNTFHTWNILTGLEDTDLGNLSISTQLPKTNAFSGTRTITVNDQSYTLTGSEGSITMRANTAAAGAGETGWPALLNSLVVSLNSESPYIKIPAGAKIIAGGETLTFEKDVTLKEESGTAKLHEQIQQASKFDETGDGVQIVIPKGFTIATDSSVLTAEKDVTITIDNVTISGSGYLGQIYEAKNVATCLAGMIGLFDAIIGGINDGTVVTISYLPVDESIVIAGETPTVEAAADATGDKTAVNETVFAINSALGEIEGAEDLAEDAQQYLDESLTTADLEAINAAISELKTSEDQVVSLVAEPYLQVEVTGAERAADESIASITLDISAWTKIWVVVTDADLNADTDLSTITNKKPIGGAGGKEMTVNSAVNLVVPVPDGLVEKGDGTKLSKLYVMHTKEDTGRSYQYEANVTGTKGGYLANFTSTHGFSEFEISGTKTPVVATVDGEEYFDFDEAVKAAIDSDKTLTLNANASSETVSLSANKTLSIDATSAGYSLPRVISAASGYSVGSSTSGTVTTYTLTANSTGGGTTGGSTGGGGGGGGGGSSKPSTGTTGTETTTPTTTMPFTDVASGAYYTDAVSWAVANGITNGTTDTTFSPNNPCTRAQVVTFLWRAAGQPEPAETTNNFTDVSGDKYYAKAVQWAVEQGITNGTTAETFSPDRTCTRAQVVTFIFRSANATAAGDNPFTDVSSDSYFAGAVNWAVANGITNGTTATTFSPSNDCTRGHVVTFLYRYFVK